jgi:hypothetical protein
VWYIPKIHYGGMVVPLHTTFPSPASVQKSSSSLVADKAITHKHFQGMLELRSIVATRKGTEETNRESLIKNEKGQRFSRQPADIRRERNLYHFTQI